MSDDDRRAAEELDRWLSALQHGPLPEAPEALDGDDTRFARRLAQLTQGTHLDAHAAAQIAARVQQARTSKLRSQFAVWQRWTHQPAFVAVLTLVLAVCTFVAFYRLRAPDAALSTRPRVFADYGQAILTYLNGQPSNMASLRALLLDWGALKASSPNARDATGDVLSVDVDGNGESDVLLALLDPENPTSDGAFLLYLKEHGTYRLAQETSAQSRPRLLFARDMLGDGRLAVGRSVATCSGAACSVAVDVLRWDHDQWHSLLTAPARMVDPEVQLSDGAPGTKELMLHGGIVDAVGAGPQRAHTLVYRWDGAAFTLAETRNDASTYLYIKVMDANVLMGQRQYADAQGLYQEAATNNRLRTWEEHDAAQERADLQAFARFRVMVGYTLLGDEAKAQVWRDYTLNQQPNHVYAR
ncbi:MAG TPA: hypothetical protein VFG86_21895, partial [Chloroflexota bacterium]|nr:hypothetical protein [Chloroflexota bacterium]